MLSLNQAHSPVVFPWLRKHIEQNWGCGGGAGVDDHGEQKQNHRGGIFSGPLKHS